MDVSIIQATSLKQGYPIPMDQLQIREKKRWGEGVGENL